MSETFIALVGRDFDLTGRNAVAENLGADAVNTATHRKTGSKDLLHGALKIFGVRLEAHLASNIQHGVKAQIAIMLDCAKEDETTRKTRNKTYCSWSSCDHEEAPSERG